MKSRSVTSNQQEIHPDLVKIWASYQSKEFLKPFAAHTTAAFSEVLDWIQAGKPLILDSGCGTGESSEILSTRFPDHLVLGVEKSIHRLSKNSNYPESEINNLKFIRADLIDLWRLLLLHRIEIERHYLYYPNPWPKKKDVKKRFHGHPIIQDLLRVSPWLELRSNWKIYMQEFALAIEFWCGVHVEPQAIVPDIHVSLFEKKYHQSGQTIYTLVAENLDCNA